MMGGKSFLNVNMPPLTKLTSLLLLQQHSQQYPTLGRIARDYLAIQGSSTPSERAFSGGGLTGTKLRNRLSPKVFESLQILKSAYRNGHIEAARQAEAHNVMDALEDDEV
jgi:hypothetical protein